MTADHRIKWRGRPLGSPTSRVRAPRPGAFNWRNRASCHGHDPELWFSYDKDDQKHAEKICQECPVRRECRATALIVGEDYGIWGGIEEKLRRRLRKELASGQAFVGILE